VSGRHRVDAVGVEQLPELVQPLALRAQRLGDDGEPVFDGARLDDPLDRVTRRQADQADLVARERVVRAPGQGVRTLREGRGAVEEDPRAQQLRLVYQSPGPDVLDFPDNVTTSPRGTLILCEDNTNDNYLRGLTRKGELFDVALNRLVSITGADRSGDEFAGSTFSPGGETLFVNVQASRGITFAIWGPWGRIGV